MEVNVIPVPYHCHPRESGDPRTE